MRSRVAVGVMVLAVVAVPAVAGGAPDLTATGEDARRSGPAVAGDTLARQSGLTATRARVGTHPGFVRVVVEFRGPGRLQIGEVQLAQPDRLLRGGRARVDVRHPGVRTRVASARGHGVRVRLTRRGSRLSVSLASARMRFKALAEQVLRRPQRLVLDLWRAAPPGPAATVRADGCLALDGFSVAPGRVRAHGRALRRLFESSLVVEVRSENGRSAGRRGATVVRGRWRRTVAYTVRRAQRGTLEATVHSAKDGSLECLVQVPVTLRPA